jgi:hypothetical protein
MRRGLGFAQKLLPILQAAFGKSPFQRIENWSLRINWPLAIENRFPNRQLQIFNFQFSIAFQGALFRAPFR